MSARRGSGHAVIELALMTPWLFTLFVGALNLGLLYHSITAVENAARAAAMHVSSSPWAAGDANGACTAALRELRTLPNIRNDVSACGAPPVELMLSYPEGLDGEQTARASLTYTSVRLIVMPPIPDQLAITRAAEMRVRVE